jgi:hypothetical protein
MATIDWGQILFCNKNHSDSANFFSETDIIKMLGVLIDIIFDTFGGHVFQIQQTVGISIGTNSARLLADLFLYLYEASSYRCFSRKTKQMMYFHKIILSLVILLIASIYPIELEIKDTTDTSRPASYTYTSKLIMRVKNETFWQKRLFQFSYCVLSIYT